MSEHMSKQMQLRRLIVRALDNFKKIGKNNLTPAKVRSRISTLKDTWSRFLEGHLIICKVILETSQPSIDYFRDEVFDATEDAFHTTLDFMAEILEELEPPVSPNSSLEQTLSRVSKSAFSVNHLPPISLPPFDTFEQWESFRDRFTALIIENRDLSNVTRMHFLTSCVIGRARDCIRDLAITADNFETAWSVLTTRFENKRRVLQGHFTSLLNLPVIARESASELASLVDKVKVAVASINNVNRSPDQLWDDILVHIIVGKLDPSTRKAWTLRIGDSKDLPSYDDLSLFVSNRVRALEDLAADSPNKPSHRTTSKVSVATASITAQCPLCNENHLFSACPLFVKRNITQRRDLVSRHRRCFNCLSEKYSIRDCKSKYSCRMCQRKHHTLLHSEVSVNENPRAPNALSGSSSVIASPLSSSQVAAPHMAVNSLLASNRVRADTQVLLATAQVNVESGHSVTVRALLDQGSELTFISENLAQLLRVKRVHMPITVSAVGCVAAGSFRHAATIFVSPNNSNSPVISTTASILPSLTSYAPKRKADISSCSHFTDLHWADSDPMSTEPISLILGADLYGSIILEGLRKGEPKQPVAQNTIFGWVLSGPLETCSPGSARETRRGRTGEHITVNHCLTLPSLESELQNFWTVEEPPHLPLHSIEEEQCENHFRSTHSRAADGRYIVRLPFKQDPPINIGESRGRAEKLLNSMLHRLKGHPAQASEYKLFLAEYEQLGHMRKSAAASASLSQRVYIPHHPVLREHSTTTRLRVVFNASCATSNGTSLNDHLLAGRKLQKDLTSVLLKWRAPRQFKFVYTADITKMYRQILIDSRDLDFQRILWKPNSEAVPIDYQLLTVTYGMTCAPFLALRVIQQLADDEGNRFPLAVSILRENMYVDDVLFGSDEISQLIKTREQLVKLLRRGGFELRKWAGNSPRLLNDIHAENHGLACPKSLFSSETLKILGIGWNPANDMFQISVALENSIPENKRQVLAAIARLYDPLGWVTPVTISAKIFMQKLWREGFDWDATLPPTLLHHWRNIYSGLSALCNLRLPRWTGNGPEIIGMELHGFSDASNAAYAAAVYLKAVSKCGQVTISLLCGKSRVAPLKPLSVPRLELSGAVLLAHIMEFIRETLSLKHVPCFCWSDSMVVLAWLRQHFSRWKMFVANRVADIQARLPDGHWRYVATADNPADCASRGLLGAELVSHPLWWHGPPWLSREPEMWPNLPTVLSSDASAEEKIVSALCTLPAPGLGLADRCSSWPKLVRITAYIFRFISRCRRVRTALSAPSSTALTSGECTEARLFWIRAIQADTFAAEIDALAKRGNVSSKSSIHSLNPFLDSDRILRVGGRLRHAPLLPSRRQPIVLARHSLVNLIIEQAHTRSLHAGIQLTLSTLRQEFWILRARSRAIIHRCVVCTRERAAVPSQLMGDLPAYRVTAPSRVFVHCGLDYAGPLLVRASAGRGVKTRKAYIALFICLATRAIHLELVADYSTAAFLNAFCRFCARRGLPTSMYSDNGTTFIGADRELSAAYHSALRDSNFQNRTASDKISWHFLPPCAPHFGGMWEAGVRSVKYHLRRVVGKHTFTFEELTTLLCRVEACLNSRPFAPLTDSLDDYNVLTPGHFLIGSAITTTPEPSVLNVNENRLSRWQMVRRMTENFWRKWYNDYINTLQQRSKWRVKQLNIEVGQLVLLRNSALPPCKWELGRVTQCHPGADNLTRVVTVRTANSEYRRPIVKLCLLPIDCDKTKV